MLAWSETVKSLPISYNLPFFGTRPKFQLQQKPAYKNMWIKNTQAEIW